MSRAGIEPAFTPLTGTTQPKLLQFRVLPFELPTRMLLLSVVATGVL